MKRKEEEKKLRETREASDEKRRKMTKEKGERGK